MAFCPACRETYPDDWRQCPVHTLSLLPSENIGKYAVSGLIGLGGMGAVYRATNPDTKSDVAIKVLHPASSGIESARIRFQREAAAVAALKTRHVVTIHDFGQGETGMLYLVMEYLEGHTVRDEIAHGNIPLQRVGRILDHTLRGLSAAHRAGIVHRDLKPDNLFVAKTDDGEVIKILDFGIARTDSGKETGLTGSGALMGTPAYMAPEQIAGNRGDIGAWTDVYAMGTILYELLTERSPFAGDSVSAVLGRILAREFDPLPKQRKSLPTPVYSLVEKSLAESTSDRFESASQLAEAWTQAWAAFPSKTRTADVPVYQGPKHSPSAVDPNSATDLAQPTSPTAPTVAASPRAASAASESPSPNRVLIVGALLAVAAIAGGVLWWKSQTSSSSAAIDAGTIDAKKTPPVDATLASRVPLDMLRFDGGPLTMGPPNNEFKDQPSARRDVVKVEPFLIDKLERVDPKTKLPYRGISHSEAAEQCKQAGKRLPSEAEWEYAARKFPLTADDACLLRAGVTTPTTPGSHQGDCSPNGLCDLLGNVAEWTADSWVDGAGKATDDKTIRGGSYKVAPDGFYASPFARYPRPPESKDPDVGFRCAKDAQ